MTTMATTTTTTQASSTIAQVTSKHKRSVWLKVEWHEENDVMADQIEELIEEGADPEEVFVHDDGVVMTPLTGAVWTQNDDAVYYLINNCKVDPNRMPITDGASGECDVTPLMSAAWNGDFDIVNTLVGLGKANTETTDQCGMTALHHASQNGTLASAQILLALGANPDARSKQNVTPLTTAVESGNTEVALALLEHGANPNIEDDGRETSFTRALRRCRHVEGLISRFLKAGADARRGLCYAKTHNFNDVVPMLEDVVREACQVQFTALLLGTHERVGENSPVQALVSDTLGEIMRHLLEANHVTVPKKLQQQPTPRTRRANRKRSRNQRPQEMA